MRSSKVCMRSSNLELRAIYEWVFYNSVAKEGVLKGFDLSSFQLATSKYFLNSQQCDTILAFKLKYGVKQTSVAKNIFNVKITKTKNIYRQKAGQFRREYCRHHYLHLIYVIIKFVYHFCCGKHGF